MFSAIMLVLKYGLSLFFWRYSRIHWCPLAYVGKIIMLGIQSLSLYGTTEKLYWRFMIGLELYWRSIDVTYDSYVRIALILRAFRDFDYVTRIEFRFSKTHHYSRTNIAEVWLSRQIFALMSQICRWSVTIAPNNWRGLRISLNIA